MTQPYLKRGEALTSYETLYFKPRKSSRKICDPASSNNHISTFLHGKIFLTESYHSLGLWEATTGVWCLSLKASGNYDISKLGNAIF